MCYQKQKWLEYFDSVTKQINLIGRGCRKIKFRFNRKDLKKTHTTVIELDPSLLSSFKLMSNLSGKMLLSKWEIKRRYLRIHVSYKDNYPSRIPCNILKQALLADDWYVPCPRYRKHFSHYMTRNDKICLFMFLQIKIQYWK